MDARQFIAELKTRGVYRVAAIYCAGAWALLQVADLFFPMLHLPEGSVTLVLVLAATGFPFALLLAWWFDLTPRGIVTAPPTVDAGRPSIQSPRQILELAVILALTISVGYLYLDRLAERENVADDTLVRDYQKRPSIAVMPFMDLSHGEETAYLGDGLAEEILNLLARLNELNVAARSTSFYYRDPGVEMKEIGRRLGVGHILEGSVRREGQHVRVTAQLVETKGGFQVWSSAYDRDIGGMLDLQEEIARKVVESLQVVLSEQSSRTLSHSYEPRPLAYDYYLKGRDYLRKPMDDANVDAAIAFFRKALEVNRDFAHAWAGLCDGLLARYESARAPEAYTEAEQACHQALSLDERSVPVYVALGNLYRVSGEYARALGTFGQALTLQPASVDAYRGRGKAYADMHQFEPAESDLLTAVRLQPNSWRAQNELATFYFRAGQFQRAIPLLQSVASLNPQSESAFNNLGSAFYMVGEPNRAAEAWTRSVALEPSAISLSNLGGSLFFAERFEEAAEKYQQAAQLAPDDFQYWGNVGEAMQFVAGREVEAAAAFDRAIALAGKQLEINPHDALTRAALASYLARRGHEPAAMALLEQSQDSPDRSILECYSRAVAFTALGRHDQAVDELETAVDMGYPPRLLPLDENFRNLRQMPRFAGLVSRAEPWSGPVSLEEIVDERK
jgi:TolB-like protein/Flp pilus assembly protein TadD